jgi:hypothetical protein
VSAVPELEARFPGIPWRTPVTVVVGGWRGRACRVCIARSGLRAAEAVAGRVPYVFEADADAVGRFREHWEREHG